MNYATYHEDYGQYKQFKATDGIQSTLNDITFNANTNPVTKNQAVLVIDSADRDHQKYPHPNKYKINLKYTYKKVSLIELKYAQIPNSAYIINNNNNQLSFQDTIDEVENCHYKTICIPIGNWSADCTVSASIRSNIEDALNEASDDNTYTVTFNRNLKKFTISQNEGGTGIFNLIFSGGLAKTGLGGTITKKIEGVDRFCYPEIPVDSREHIYLPKSIGCTLGFLPKNVCGKLSYTSQMVINLNPDRFVVLKISDMERIQSNNSRIDGAFGIIGMDDGVNNFVLSRGFDFINNETYSKNYNPPKEEVDSIEVEILDCRGNPYDFNGRDHVLIFDILSLTRFDNF